MDAGIGLLLRRMEPRCIHCQVSIILSYEYCLDVVIFDYYLCYELLVRVRVDCDGIANFAFGMVSFMYIFLYLFF